MMDQTTKRKRKRPPSVWESVFRGSLPLESETMLFILVSALDVFMTHMLLWHSARGQTNAYLVESNAIARFFLESWGMRGMVYFKFTMVAVVAVIAQFIARQRIETARRLLNFATLVVAAVVVYSLFLFARTAYFI